MKAHYAFKEQVAMVDFTYNEDKSGDEPLAKVNSCCLLLFHLRQCIIEFDTSADLLRLSVGCLTNHCDWLQAYIKAGAGEKGFGPLSVGFIVDKTIDV